MKILFSCLGFSTCEVVVEHGIRQDFIGYIDSRKKEFEFFEGGLWERHLTKDQLPTPEQIYQTYEAQLAERGCTTKTAIVYAG